MYIHVHDIVCIRVCVCVCVRVCVCAVNGRQPLPTLDTHEVKEVQRELAQIRDRVNVILDSLDGRRADESVGGAGGGASRTTHVATPQLPATAVKTEGEPMSCPLLPGYCPALLPGYLIVMLHVYTCTHLIAMLRVYNYVHVHNIISA